MTSTICYTLGVRTKNKTYILLLTVIFLGKIVVTFPSSTLANTDQKQNQKLSIAGTAKRLIFSIRNGFYNRFGKEIDYGNKHTTTAEVYPYDDNQESPANTQYNKQGEVINSIETSKNNSTPSKNSFWNKILTIATNAYNGLGRTIGFTTTEKNVKYNEQGTVDNFTESSQPETTAAPKNSIDYDTVGRIIQKKTMEIKNSPTLTPAIKRTQSAAP